MLKPNGNRLRHCGSWRVVYAILCVASSSITLAAPGDTLFYDHLNGNLNSWTITASGGDASVGGETANQGRSMRLRWGPVRAFTNAIAAAVPGAQLSVWIRRGDDSFSDNPETGENLVVEYRDAGGSWVVLDTYAGGGTPGQVYTPTYTLPPAALHANLSLRFQLTAGSGSDLDYWHIDDVRVTETAAAGGGLSLGGCDNFESGLAAWTVTGTGGGSAGTSQATANSPTSSLYTRSGVVNVVSNPVDLSAASLVNLEIWVRRGADSFSENPENGENFVVEYRSSGGSWTLLETFPGGGTPGEIFVRSYPLAADALHVAFAVRLRQTGGNGANNDFWHADDVCLTAVTPVFYSLEETTWTGAPAEVIDGNGGGFNGTAFGGAQNDNANPALPSNPGSCRYGQFDGIDDYIEIADAAAFDLTTELTVASWIYMRSLPTELHTIASKDWNYEYHVNQSGQIYWWWNDSTGTTRTLTTANSIALNRWYHVAIVYRSGSQTIYVDGTPWATQTYTGTLRVNDLPFYIGADWNFISRAFDGFIDEVYVIPRAYSQAQVQALRDATHDCPNAAAEFSINHDGFGINCVPEAIAVNVIDSVSGTPLISYNAQVRLDTQSGDGTWTLVSGGGGFSDATPGDGIATYDWPLGESQALFALSYTQGTSPIDIDVYQISDPGIRDTDAEGPLPFSPNGFTLTSTPLSNPPPATIVPFSATQTAAIPFNVYITAFGQTANDPVCGVIESYAGIKSLKFWSSYQNPATGFRNVEVDALAIATNEAAATAQAVMFTDGQAQVAGKYKDAGSIRLTVKDDTTIDPQLPNGIRGATASFVSQPARFVLSNIRDGAGTIINPQAADAAGPVFIAAGTDFRTTVTALDAEGDPTPNYGRELIAESVRLDVELVAPSGGASPGIGAAVGFGPFAAGTATGTDFRWGEVGIMRLRPGIGDGDYLGAGDVIGDVSENIGRFVPNHFALALNVPIFTTQCAAGSFTYTGQTFGYSIVPTITATAQGAAGNTTVNYTGAFFKMATATLQNRVYASATGTLDTSGLPPVSGDPAVVPAGPGIAAITFSAGAGLSFARSIMDAPFDADISLSIDVLDADGVAALANPAVFGSPGGIAFSDGPEIRFGRMRFTNAVGSELVNLAVPLVAEYFAGPATGFVLNVADSCTSNVTLTLTNYTENLASGDTCVLDTGFPGASGAGCPAPAPIGQQFREPPITGDFNLTLAAPGPGKNGSVQIDASVPAWLQFDWDVATVGDENPFGHATFGLYPGHGKQIYLREVY
jgi:MSHA biogenesis protein MshQ